MPTTISGNDGVSQVQNNTIVQADLTTAILPIGVGQSWVNQTSVRAFNTDYTNDTGRPIMVNIISGINSGINTFLYVNGILVQMTSVGAAAAGLSMSTIVPAGATYRVSQTGGASLTAWAELR